MTTHLICSVNVNFLRKYRVNKGHLTYFEQGSVFKQKTIVMKMQ